MKKIFLIIGLTFLIACNKNDDNTPAIDKLPPATQTGEVVFACLVDGEPFVRKGYGPVTAYYQWVDGGHVFFITGDKSDGFIRSIHIGNRDHAPIEEGYTYTLDSSRPGYFFGGGFN